MPTSIDRECRACGNVWSGSDMVCPKSEHCPECGTGEPKVLFGSSGSSRHRDPETMLPQTAPPKVAQDKTVAGLHRIELSKGFQDSLAGQPETGMGFQDVTCETHAGKKVAGVVINGRFLETVAPLTVEEIKSIDVMR